MRLEGASALQPGFWARPAAALQPGRRDRPTSQPVAGVQVLRRQRRQRQFTARAAAPGPGDQARTQQQLDAALLLEQRPLEGGHSHPLPPPVQLPPPLPLPPPLAAQHRQRSPLLRRLAPAAAAAAATLLAALLPRSVAPAHAAAGLPSRQQPPPAAAAAADAQPSSPSASPVFFASVGIGGTSPSAFRSERAFDVAGFKLAGLLQQVLSAHIVVKVRDATCTTRELGWTCWVAAGQLRRGFSLQLPAWHVSVATRVAGEPPPTVECFAPPIHPSKLPPTFRASCSAAVHPPQIVALVLVGAPIIYAAGCLYAAITGTPVALGVFKVYTVVLRAPGARVTEETRFVCVVVGGGGDAGRAVLTTSGRGARGDGRGGSARGGWQGTACRHNCMHYGDSC